MIEKQKNTAGVGEPTVSDDPKLYAYTNEDAPEDVVVNIGNAPVVVSAPHAVTDPHRLEVGDRRRGAYYLTLIGHLPGLQPLRRVDKVRLEQVNKIRDIRIGDREPDWIAEMRKKSAQEGGEQPMPFNPASDKTPLQRAAQGI